jgi:Gpi18-like mannosyltransferase
MNFFANSTAILALLITLLCLILLIQRIILNSNTDKILPIVNNNETNYITVNKFKSDSKLIKRLNYLNFPFSNFRLYENLDILTKILPFFFVNRMTIFILNFTFYISENSGKLSILEHLKAIWSKWDTANYLSIAQHGYQNTGDERFLIVFYPLYPLLINIFNRLINDYFLSGLVVSNIFLIVALFYVYRLILMELKNDEIAFNTIKYILIFPFSFFFSIVYTESLFMCLCIMTFYFLREKNWLLSGFLGLLAALTRTQGILLLISIITEIIYECKNLNNLNKKSQPSINKKYFVTYLQMMISLLLVPFGTFGYLLLNKFVSGEWLTFLTYQKEHWIQNFGFFAENLKNGFINIFALGKIMAINVWIPQTFLFFLSFSILIHTFRNMRISYALFSFAYILISFSPTWLLSGSRYITGMFTLYIMLAIFVSKYKHLEKYLDFITTMLLCFYCIQFSLSRVF